jgi:putative phosphoribosyl transferase
MAWAMLGSADWRRLMSDAASEHVETVHVGPAQLEGVLAWRGQPHGLVLFAHGSGSGRYSPRNNFVADGLRAAGCATLLLDLLQADEEDDRSKVFDIPLLAQRLMEAANWTQTRDTLAALPLGLFGASTGAGAALVAAAELPQRVAAVVSRGGRPDLAGEALERVSAPTLLIVGSRDTPVIALNRDAAARIPAYKELVIVPGASHLFEEPGTLEQVRQLAATWFASHLRSAQE